MAPTLVSIIGFDGRAENITQSSGTSYWNGSNNTTGLTYVAGRNNGWALQIVQDGVTANGTYFRRALPASSIIVISAWGKGSVAPVTTSTVMTVSDSAGTIMFQSSLTASTGIPRAAAGTGTARSGLTSVTDGAWHLFEYLVDTTAATWTVDAQVDGVPFALQATVAGTAGLQAVRISFGSATTAHNATWTWDEVMVSNTEADYPLSDQAAAGEIGVQALYPNAEGTDRLADSSNPIIFTGAATGWQAIDALRTGAVDTGTYVTYTSTTTGGAASNYTEALMDNVDASTSAIWGVSGVAAVTSAAGGTNALSVRVVDVSNNQLGEPVAGSSSSFPNTSWLYSLIAAPGTGWLTNINTTKVQVGRSTDTAPLPRCLGAVLEVAAVISVEQTVTLPSVLSYAAAVISPTPVFVGSKTVALGLIDQSATVGAIGVSNTVELTNTFDTGLNGTTITVANSDDGGQGDDAFAQVVIGVGATLVYDTTNKLHGASAAAFNPAAATTDYVEWRPISFNQWYGRMYINLSGLPTNTQSIVYFRDSATATNRGIVGILTDGRLRLFNTAAATIATTTATLTPGSWSRIEFFWFGDATGGSMQLKLFNTVESTTATETITSAATNTTGAIDRIRFGQVNAVAGDTPVFYIDNVEFNTTEYPGPWFAESQTVTLPAVLDYAATNASFSINFIRGINLPSVLDNAAVTLTAPVFSNAGGAQSVGTLPLVGGGAGWGSDPWGGSWGGAGGAVVLPINVIRGINLPAVLDYAATTLVAPQFVAQKTVTLPAPLNYAATATTGIDTVTFKVTLDLIDQAAVALDLVVEHAKTVTLPAVLDNAAVVLTAPQFNPQTVELDAVINNLAFTFNLDSIVIANQIVTLPVVLDNTAVAFAPDGFFVFAGQTVTLPAVLDQSAVALELDETANAPGLTVTLVLIDQSAVANEPREVGEPRSTAFKRAKYSDGVIANKRAKYSTIILKRAAEDPQA